ncbi:flavin-dependent monooxygenase, partial [Sphingobium sp. AS12]|uniref:acyl-CoA dehydrogenase family protein n=1 Tax=Sphingobium sp. AS12 TaxID=2849495 RepID=UPI0034A3C227|nr:flavin-dependent monooxygenase [Sphingobium sp. AS12]
MMGATVNNPKVEPAARTHEGDPDPLLRQISDRASEFEAAGQIPADVIDLLRRLGVYRAAVARRFGGDERPFADILRLVERIAQADGSAGWVASFAPQTALYLATLP